MNGLLFFCFVIFFTSPLFSQLSEATSPEAAGFSAARLKRIDPVLQEYVSKGTINGMVALIVKDGKITYYKAFGANDANGTPLKRDAIFRIASQTKAITSVAVMMLY